MPSAPVHVVTGATGFLGREVCRELLARGAQVAVPYRGARSWDDLREALGDPSALWGAPADLADPASMESFAAEAARTFGHLDGLAAVAGAWTGSGPLEGAPVEEWRRMLSANLDTFWSATRAVLPHLLARGAGSVVAVGARAATEGGAGAAAYVVAKAGVAALTRVLALENRERGVRFNCVVPGTIDTPSNRRDMPGADFTRWTAPAAIASVIAYLLSPASAPATGAVIPVDGPSPRP
ncbi:MAG: SDR family oxidoreductase [Vicinamibacteria bacterium]|nr:SDR family oxidoreductase [Vicinamibacteria bacterium]